jgi:plasmid maintenance system antidote protein VapI
MPADQERKYGEICRDLIDQVCRGRGISRARLAEEMEVHEQTLMSRAYRGLLSFERAVDLARRAGADVELLAEMERAWFLERASKDSRGPLRRVLRLNDKYREALLEIETFLRQHGLWAEYLSSRGWNPEHGLMGDSGSKPPKRSRSRP